MIRGSKRDLRGLVDQGVVSGTTLFTSTIFLRSAGLEEFGVLSLVMLVLLFAMSIQHAALVAPAYSILPKLEQQEAALFRGWLTLVQGALTLLLLVVLALGWLAAAARIARIPPAAASFLLQVASSVRIVSASTPCSAALD